MTQVFIDNHYSTEYMEFVFELRREVRSDLIIAVMKVVVKVSQCTSPASHRSGLKIGFRPDFLRP